MNLSDLFLADETCLNAEAGQDKVPIGIDLIVSNNFSPRHQKPYLKRIQPGLKPDSPKKVSLRPRALKLDSLILYVLEHLLLLRLQITLLKLRLLISLARLFLGNTLRLGALLN